MNNKEQYDIFISYRRKNSYETANLIAERLKYAGYRVFFDLESLRSGKFNEKLFSVIENCKDFLVVLPEGGLDHCSDPEDWVRLEVMHALKHKKNIIPIMLKNFNWPNPMPEGMEELSKYQAITATDHQYFDASMDKLRSYLHSRRGFFFNRYNKAGLVMALVIVILLGAYGLRNYNSWKEFERVSNNESIQMASELSKIHQAVNFASGLADSVLLAVALQPNEKMKTRKFHRNIGEYVLLESSNFLIKTQHELQQNSFLVLSDHGVRTKEIVEFYSISCPAFKEKYFEFIDRFILYAESPVISDSMIKSIRLNYNGLFEYARGIYLGYLGLLTTLPKSVYSDDFYKLRSQFFLFRDIPMNKTLKEYKSDQELCLVVYDNIMKKIGKDCSDFNAMLERQKDLTPDQLEKIQDSIIARRVVNLNKKKGELDDLRLKLEKKLSDLEESYRRVLTKNSFTADEDQWTMWGKILRVSTVSRNVIKSRKEHKALDEINRKEAIRNGIDPKKISETRSAISVDEMFNELDKRLDLYIEFNKQKDPNVIAYGNAAKRYYKLLKRDDIEDEGILVIGIENNQIHPVLKAGDIVLERKGTPVFSFEDYAKLKDVSGPNVLKLLRFDAQGNKSIQTVTVPPTEIKVGFLDLRE